MTTLRMGGNMGIRTIANEHARLREALDSADDHLTLEFDEDLVADATILQLIAAARLSGTRNNKTIGLRYRLDGRFAAMLEDFGLRPDEDRWVPPYDVFWADGEEDA